MKPGEQNTSPTSPGDRGVGSAAVCPDPVHPATGMRAAARTTTTSRTTSPTKSRAVGTIRTSAATPPATGTGAPPRGRVPLASNLGAPVVFDHRVAALEVGSPVSPVAVHRWTGERLETLVVTPAAAYIWARAGRITMVCRGGAEHRFTVLAPEEYEGVDLGEPWPRHQPHSRAQRVARAAAHDVADVLTFPLWLKRTAHVSGERNKTTHVLMRRIHAACPGLEICRDATYGVDHGKPGQLSGYNQRGILGHEGYPDKRERE